MHKDITRVAVSVAAAAALSTLGVSGAGAPGAAAGVWQRAGHPAAGASKAAAVAGTQLWVKRYNGPGSGDDQAAAMAVSPGGGKVFVTGTSTGATTGKDYATVAYNAATGARLWVKRYNGPTSGDDQAASVAVSPDGTVFVTGTSNFEYLTLACNPATGARLWVKREPRGTNADRARAVAASPDGSKVFVTGTSFTEDDSDQLTVAYNAATGAELWAQDHGGTQIHSFDYANSMAVSPDGDIVFVAGNSQEETGEALITLAYNAFTGDQLWVQRWFTSPGPTTGPMPRPAMTPPSAPYCLPGATRPAAPAPASRWPSAPPGTPCSSPATAPGPLQAPTMPPSPTTLSPAPGCGPGATPDPATALTKPRP
jgi:outer membrane protein assembly factor BamB